MNAFRTPVIADESSIKMRYGHAAMLAGSCFSMNIGAKLEERKFEVMCNPFGIIYNPVSLSHFLERLSSGRHYLKEDLITYRGRWAGPDHHGSFTVPDASLCLEKLNASLDAAVSFFDRVDFLFITLGTAWVYKWGEDKRILANCHK
ncbi:MAG: GSCFA domain-containing protein, partial [Flavobacteriales bacterium]